jgi:hypothetical protein
MSRTKTPPRSSEGCEFQARDADQPMGERKAYALRLVLAVDLTDAKSNGYRDRMNG